MAKKSFISNIQKKQAPPVSHSHAHIVGAVSGLIPPIQDEEDDDEDDDICPVCESECTCRHKPGVSDVATSALAPSTPSTTTFDGSTQEHPSHPSLKIKITVPPKLKNQPSHNANGAHATPSPTPQTARPSGQFAAIQSHTEPSPHLVVPPPKRRGRPPKAVIAVREAAKAASLANGNGHGNGRRNKPSTISKKTSSPHLNSTVSGNSAVAQTFSATSDDDEDDIVSGIFPTFMSAASSLSHSSSSDSSSELDSDDLMSDAETGDHSFSLRASKAHARMSHGDDTVRKRRDHAPNNNWEIRPRKKSVGADGDSDLESADTSDVDEDGYIEDQENADEGDDDDDDDEDEAEADVEGGGLEALELDEDDARIGVSFDGVPTGWSEDEESSFDADLFFANLDDTSDDSSSSSPLHDEEDSETESDVVVTSMSSVAEDGTVFFMDIERLLQLQRDRGDFDLDFRDLSFEWDGLVLADSGHLRVSNGSSIDVEMQSDSESTCTDAQDDLTDEAMFEDGDGDTTEDELVDSNGLPNSRAMMLFQWPNVVSAINPLSTVGGAFQETQSHGSQTVRIALASMSARRDAPCPSPADILSGRFAMDDIDDIDSDKHHMARNQSRQRSGPVMGEFNAQDSGRQERCAIIDGKGGDIPSPFPRRSRKTGPAVQRLCKAKEPNNDEANPATAPRFLSPAPGPASSTSPSADEDATVGSISDHSSTQAIDLDDVLHAAFLDTASTEQDRDMHMFDEPAGRTDYVNDGTHTHCLSRWDRIPVATFRRTREVATFSAVEGSASDTGMSVYGGMGAMISNSMLARHDRKGKGHSASRRSSGRGSNMVVISPVLMPLRDGDASQNHKSTNRKAHNKKTRKELRREKAMMKKNMISKSAPYQSHTHQHHYPRHRQPKQKARAPNTSQRTNFFVAPNSYVPPLSL